MNGQDGLHPARDSAPMLVALGVTAYAASMMTHEALGHGAYCIAAGGHNTMLTVWQERCSTSARALGPGMKAVGPGIQFLGGLLAWLVLQIRWRRAARLRLFVWLYMALSLMISSGYLMFSGVSGLGDAGEVIAQFSPQVAWRSGLFVLGSVLYFGSMLAAAFELKRLAGLNDGMRRLFRLVGVPYAVVGVFACGMAALNHTMPRGLAVGYAVASSLGAGSGLFGLPALQRGMHPADVEATSLLRWSTGWGVASLLVILLFVFRFAPGLVWASR
jgi:hypothetical protein